MREQLNTVKCFDTDIVISPISEIEEFFRDRLIEKKDARHVVTINSDMLILSGKHESFRKLITGKTINICDGIGVKLMARLMYNYQVTRCAGADLAYMWCRLAEETGAGVFLLGGMYGVSQGAANYLLKIFPKLNVVGHLEEPNLNIIIESKPEILLVCFGVPKQELWIDRNYRKIPSLVLVGGFGGTFNFWSGRVKRSPLLLRKIGLEWIWRLIQEPRRFKKAVISVAVFPFWTVSKRSNSNRN